MHLLQWREQLENRGHKFSSVRVLGPVVRKLESAIHWIVVFSSAVKCSKSYEIADMDLATDEGKV